MMEKLERKAASKKWQRVGSYSIYKFDEPVKTKGLKFEFTADEGKWISAREFRLFQGTESKPYRFKTLEKLDEDRSVFVYLMQKNTQIGWWKGKLADFKDNQNSQLITLSRNPSFIKGSQNYSEVCTIIQVLTLVDQGKVFPNVNIQNDFADQHKSLWQKTSGVQIQGKKIKEINITSLNQDTVKKTNLKLCYFQGDGRKVKIFDLQSNTWSYKTINNSDFKFGNFF